LAAGIIGVASLVLLLGGDAPKGTAPIVQRDNEGRVIPTMRNAPLTIPQPPKPTGAQGYNFQTGTINNTINVVEPNATASDIIKKLDDYYKATGARLSQ
jgi:hypothetical protein